MRPSGRYCWCCGRRRANERFSRRSSKRGVCSECHRLGPAELAYRQIVENIARVLRCGELIPKRHRKLIESALTHGDPRARAYAANVIARDADARRQRAERYREDDAFLDWPTPPSSLDSDWPTPPSDLEPGWLAPPSDLDPDWLTPPSDLEPDWLAPPSDLEPGWLAPPSDLDPDWLTPPSSLDPDWPTPPSDLDTRWLTPPSDLDTRWLTPPSDLDPDWPTPPSDLEPGWPTDDIPS